MIKKANSIKNIDDIELIKLCIMAQDNFICDRHLLYFTMGLNTCLKPSELLSLTWDVLLYDDYCIKDFINYNNYKFYLNQSCKQTILSFLNKYDNYTKHKYIFGNAKPITIQAINKLYGSIEKELCLDYNFSALSLHKTFAYWQIMNYKNDFIKMCKLRYLLYEESKSKDLATYAEYNFIDDNIYINDVNL